MKKMSVMCMVILSLAIPGFSSDPIYLIQLYSEQDGERLREEFKDATKVRRHFEECLLGSPPERIAEFKLKFDISDEPMRAVLMDIIRESEKTGGRWEGYKPGDSQNIGMANRRMLEAIPWLGICADAKAKQLLLGIAAGKSNWELSRMHAVQAYMRRADAQEIRDGVARLFAGDGKPTDAKGPDFSRRVYWYAIQAFDESEGDTQKREAIITSLSAVLVKEDSKELFASADKLLAERSKEYAESPQRKAALQRLNITEEKAEQ
jgi:hypothetical protein